MKLKPPNLSWNDAGLPFSEDYGDVYFSDEDPQGENLHVFIKGNNLETRFSKTESKRFTLGELGFGSGLNFLLSWQEWLRTIGKSRSLHYVAFELHPLSKMQLGACHKLWPELKELSEALIEQWPEACAGCHRLLFDGDVILDLHFGDALSQLSRLPTRSGIDAWFLDGFSPSKNRNLWDVKLVSEITRVSDQGATLTSYSAAGDLRRALEQCGFRTQKTTGFGRKRHMLQAVLEKSDVHAASGSSPSEQNPSCQNSTPEQVAIIGGGLAGCSLAYSLNLRNIKSTIIECGPTLASGASGIPQFALRPRLFQEHSPLSEFYLLSYLFAYRLLQSLQKEENIPWANCGVYQQLQAQNKSSGLNIEKLESLYPETVLSFKNCEFSNTQGNGSKENDFYFSHGGWVIPEVLCNTLATLSNAEVALNTEITKLERLADNWITTDRNQQTAQFSTVILANSQGILSLAQTEPLPLESLSGQVSFVSGSGTTGKINSVLCGKRTLFPETQTNESQHLIAASYRRSTQMHKLAKDDQENIALMIDSLSDPQLIGRTVKDSAIAVRSNTLDRSPLVGAVPNFSVVSKELGELSRNARIEMDIQNADQLYWPELYLSAGHGSNGLATCFLSAEILASMITNEFSPVNEDVLFALNPIRFKVRDLKKQRA